MCCPQRAQRRAHREAASGAALTGLVYVLHSSSSGSGSGSRHRTPRAAVPAMPAVPLCGVATQMLSVSSPCCAHPCPCHCQHHHHRPATAPFFSLSDKTQQDHCTSARTSADRSPSPQPHHGPARANLCAACAALRRQ